MIPFANSEKKSFINYSLQWYIKFGISLIFSFIILLFVLSYTFKYSIKNSTVGFIEPTQFPGVPSPNFNSEDTSFAFYMTLQLNEMPNIDVIGSQIKISSLIEDYKSLENFNFIVTSALKKEIESEDHTTFVIQLNNGVSFFKNILNDNFKRIPVQVVITTKKKSYLELILGSNDKRKG